MRLSFFLLSQLVSRGCRSLVERRADQMFEVGKGSKAYYSTTTTITTTTTTATRYLLYVQMVG